MGLIKSAVSSISSTLHDQWEEYITCDSLDNNTLVVKKTTKNGIISNKSRIQVAPGQVALIFDSGKILDATAEEGIYTFDSSSSPSFGGTASYSRTYSLGTVQNGFTAVNSSSGVLTATHRGTTPGAARTSGTVTGNLVVTYTHASSYSGGGTVTSNTKTSTATCTQGANVLEGITFTVNSKTISYQGTTKGTVTARYTSGSTKDVENDAYTSYTDESNPDIVTFTKTS